MQVRWRQYELIFITTVCLLLGYEDLWKLPSPETSNTAGTLLPMLLSYMTPLVLVVLINTWLLPRYLYSGNQLVILPLAAILSWLMLFAAFTLSFSLRLGIRIDRTSIAGTVTSDMRGLPGLSGSMTILYTLYLFVRESIIRQINQPHAHQAFRIMVCNHIMAVAFIYSGIFIFMDIFHLLRSDGAGIFYIFILLPVIIIVFLNLYVLFPYRHRKQLPFFPFAWKLLIAPFILSLMSWIFYIMGSGHVNFMLLPTHWLILSTMATPLSWLLFIQQKNKLATLQQLKKDLGKTTADLAFLRSQINPHFLFNTLNTLYGTALQENATRTSAGIQRLGDMMRFLLHDNHRDEIPLSRELEYLQNYIALQQLRIAQSPGIKIETSIHGCAQDHLIAPMLLIPFVENAFKHGIRLTSPSYIRIHFHCNDNGFYLDVVNSVHPKRKEAGMPAHSGVGLQNVQQRLQLIYPGTHTLLVQEDNTAFEIHLHIVLPASNRITYQQS